MLPVVSALAVALLASGAAGSSSAVTLSGVSPADDVPVPGPVATASPSPSPAPAPAPSANPLAGRPWGVYKGKGEPAWEPYVDATGDDKALLGKIALRPKARWFGKWISNATIQDKVHDYVANATGGNPDTLVQLAVFRMAPWEHEACTRLPTLAEQVSFRQWIRSFGAGIGSAHAAVVLQPDGPFALCAPGGSTLPSRLIAYAARRLSTLPNTSVYIDGGASDWPAKHPERSATILVRAGVRYARGFALNSTHYASTADNVTYGAAVAAELARRGIPDKHFVVNTSSNGQPFTFGHAPGPDPDNATACATTLDTACVTLGIPPTAAVASTRWGLARSVRVLARDHVDGFLWFGRPWLYRQASPFDRDRALALARTTPY